MFEKKDLEKIKKKIEEFFEKMGFEVEIELSIENETLQVNLTSNEPQILIGEKGSILVQVQRLLKGILNRKIGKFFYIDLDINDYKKKKIQYLKEMAKEAADKVALTKEERALSPMPAYERRVIHLELADRADVTTQSIGREPERRVVIKPYS